MNIPVHKHEERPVAPTRSKVGFSVCVMVTVVILMALASIGPRAGSTRAFHLSKPLQSSDPAIFVNNNTDLAAIADLGNGTAGNPYVIANKTIFGASGSACILIQNTNAHIRILNCTTLHSIAQYGDIGISLVNCTNVELAGNNASLNMDGMSIQYCNRINISGNFVALNSKGLNIVFSNNFSCVDNVILDTGTGIFLSSLSTAVLIENNTIENCATGIDSDSSTGCNVSGNAIINSSMGIFISSSFGMALNGNNLTSMFSNGIYLSACMNCTINKNIIIGQHSAPVNGIGLSYCANLSLSQNCVENATFYINQYGPFQHFASLNIDSTNLVDGKSIYYFVNKTRLDTGNMTSPGCIFLVNCNDSRIVSPVGQGPVRDISLFYARNNTISSFVMMGELVLYSSTNNTVLTNVIRHPQSAGIRGIGEQNGTANIIRNNDILVNSRFGIYSGASNRSIIEQNKVTSILSNGDGISLGYCTNIIVRDNLLCNNPRSGILIYSCTNISITGNDISRNSETGIKILYSSNSSISNNDITSNLGYGIDLWSSTESEIAWNRIYYNEEGCINQDDYSFDNDVHDNDCRQSTTWTMDHIVNPAIKICAILGILVFTIILYAKYKGRIRKWVASHSRDVSLALEYEALKERVKEKRFIKPRIVEFYSLNSLGIVLSLAFHFFKDSFPADDLATSSILTFFQYSFLVFIALSILGIWGFRNRITKALLPMRYLSGVLSIWALVYFISYVIWPLYVLRYAYEVAETGILAVFFPGSEIYIHHLDYYGIEWQYVQYFFEFSVTCAHPGIWGAFIGIVLFLPGQSIVSKIKKGFLLFILDHVIYLVTLIIEDILYIESGLDWYDVHAGPVSGAINIPIAIAWRFIALLVLFPDIKILLKKTFQMARTRLNKSSPIHSIKS